MCPNCWVNFFILAVINNQHAVFYIKSIVGIVIQIKTGDLNVPTVQIFLLNSGTHSSLSALVSEVAFWVPHEIIIITRLKSKANFIHGVILFQ